MSALKKRVHLLGKQRLLKCSYPSLLRTCSGTALVIQASSHLNHYRWADGAWESTWSTLTREGYVLPGPAVVEQSKCSVHCVTSHCDWPQQKENTCDEEREREREREKHMLQTDSQASFETGQPDSQLLWKIMACFKTSWLDDFETGWIDTNVVVAGQFICRSF